MPLFIDAHQDLAWNMLSYGRDYRLSAHATRELERGTSIPARNNGDRLCGYPDFLHGQVAVIISSLFATPNRWAEGAWETQVFKNPDQAYLLYRGNLETYLRLADQAPDMFRLIQSRRDLDETLDQWSRHAVTSPTAPLHGMERGEDPHPQPLSPGERGEEQLPNQLIYSSTNQASSINNQQSTINNPPVGFVLSMEGADCVRVPQELEEWREAGVWIIGPARTANQYAGGTREPGELTPAGKTLLKVMLDLGLTLDVSHMDAPAARQALEYFDGTVIASHSNPEALLKGQYYNRHLPDDVIEGIIEHDGVIGLVPFNAFLQRGWTWSTPNGKQVVSLEDFVAHIDYICQLAGSARHAGFGTDFDGGFGVQGVPREVDTIADLQQVAALLANRGYTSDDIDLIFHGNWVRMLQRTLP